MDGSRRFAGRPPDWWDRLDRLVAEASALAPAEREVFLERVCADDPALRAEVASLAAHSTTGDQLLASIAASLFTPPATDSPRTTHLDDFIGREVDRFRIEARLGSGGMGVVYRALDTRLGRPVALKFLWPDLSGDADRTKRLLVEARAAAALDHPNICSVHEVGQSPDGGLYIAMGFYEGETLKAKLSRGPLSIAEAVDAVLQTARGVAAAHARGIIHRDIKPGNVLVTPEGVAKLLDFGIAKHGDMSVTGEKSVVGTTAYMSPEQFRGGPVDARSDVWALGVLAYELLASRRPFDGDSPARVLYAVLNEEPKALARPDLPRPVQTVIRRALCKDPAGRHQSAAEFIDELSTAITDLEGVARSDVHPPLRPENLPKHLPARHPARRRFGVVAAGALVLSVSAGAVLHQVDAATIVGEGPFDGVPIAEAAGTISPVPQRTIAVLAFDDMTPDVEDAWLVEGMGEAIQDELAEIPGLRVVGHYSSMTFRGVPAEAGPIGVALGADYLLAGELRRSGDSVWVSPQLVEAATGTKVWEASYGRVFSPRELQQIRSDLAHEAARALELRVAPPREPPAVMPNPSAYQAYLEGRYHLRRFQSGIAMREEELTRSVAYLRQVVAQSPSWGPGLTALGEALSWVGMFESEFGKLTSTFAESQAVLERALEVNPLDARAYASLGYVVHRKDLDFGRANGYFQRALELDPNQYWHCGYAYFLLWAGRYEEAAQAFRQAEAQDPLYLVLQDFLTFSYLCTGRFEEAIAAAEPVLASLPQWTSIRRNLVLALAGSGRVEEAFATIDQSPRPEHPYWDVVRALLHARQGRHEQASDLIRDIDEAAITDEFRSAFPSRQLSPAPVLAAALVALGRNEEAIQMLQTAVDRDPDVLLYDRCYPELRLLEGDARYQDLLRRTGVPIA